MKVVSIIGARPQFIKASPICRLLRQSHKEILVHTGQHYDENLSDIFFEELGIPSPDFNLGIGSGSHGSQTGAMLSAIEVVLLDEKPNWVLVYGDTNSTLAGALAAAKLKIRLCHVEAGLRSYNRSMPEEINRRLTDHVSDLLLCPSETAVTNLLNEGITFGVYNVGDVMVDALEFAVDKARERSDILTRLGIVDNGYILTTVHRAENTDNSERLKAILSAFAKIEETIIFPVHPRTSNSIKNCGIRVEEFENVKFIEPVGYLDMVRLQQSARVIMTDSGGIQKEAYWLSVPCITLRDETEWMETVSYGWNKLVGAEPNEIINAVKSITIPTIHPPLYRSQSESASELCVRLLDGE
jgi:UDP-GlcNAc3NAcA epimerase